MKKIIFSILAFSLITGSVSCQEKVDIAKEKAAIIAVIEEETNAFLKRDFDRLAVTFVQDETSIRLSANKSGYGYLVGWKQIGSRFKEYFEDDSESGSVKLVKTNYQIKVYKESAWSIFDEVGYDGGGEVVGKSIGVRFLEKVDGEWKIVYLSQVNISSYEDDDEDEAKN